MWGGVRTSQTPTQAKGTCLVCPSQSTSVFSLIPAPHQTSRRDFQNANGEYAIPVVARRTKMYVEIIPMSDTHCHIDVSRLLDFFMSGLPLSDEEHHHFLHCEGCTYRLADRLLDEMRNGREVKIVVGEINVPNVPRRAFLLS